MKTTDYHRRIKQFRELRNFTQEYMAEVLKISQRQYSSLENGQTQLTVERLFEISEVLQVQVGEIIGLENNKVYHNNFNNHGSENKGNLVFHEDNYEELKSLYERMLKIKDNEIEFLRKHLDK